MNPIYKAYLEGYEFQLNSYFSEAWRRFKHEAGPFIGMGLLFLIINIFLSYLPYFNFLNGFITTLLFSGFYVFCRNMDLQTQTGADFLKGLNYTIPIMMYQVLVFLIIAPLFLIVFSSIMPTSTMFELFSGNISPSDIKEHIQLDSIQNTGFFMLQVLLVFGIAIYVSVSYSLSIPLIIDAKLGFWEAMELSRKTIGRHFFSFLFFWILYAFFIAFATILTLGLGLIVLIPFSYVLLFEIYDQIFKPLDELESID